MVIGLQNAKTKKHEKN